MADEEKRDDEELPGDEDATDAEVPGDEDATDAEVPGDEDATDAEEPPAEDAEDSPPAGEHRIVEDPDPDPEAPPPPATYAGRRAQERGDEPDEADEAEDAGEAPAQRPDTDEFSLEGEITEDEIAAELDREEQPVAEEPGTEKEPDAGPEPDGEDEPDAEQEPGAEDEPAEEERDETIEADTVGLADREAAKEAAMEGLRNRTAEQAARRKRSTGQIPAKGAAAGAAAAGAVGDEAAAEDADEAEVPEAKGEGKIAEQVPAVAVEAADEEEKASQRGLWPRFVAASLVVVISMATATAVSLLVYLTDIAKGLGGLESLQNKLEEVEGGKPQNFLILGSDQRPTDTDQGRSDTTILMRIDPNKNLISLFSLPRDLKVNIPGHGIDRLNAAYTYGGPDLTLDTVKQVTGVEVNHVVNVDFLGFADAVNAIDCVYIDVDRHYFNDNSTVSVEEQYAEIDIEAGYQRLCGLKALQYVRYRHEDNDLVRAARQQDFLREARQGVPPGKLLADRNELIEIFKKYTTSDVNDIETLINLFKLLIDARGAPVKEVQFKGDIGGPTSSYVTASNEQIRSAIDEFMGEGVPVVSDSDEEQQKPSGGGAKPGKEKPKPGKEKPKPDKEKEQEEPPPADLIDATAAGQQYAAAVDSKDFDDSIYYPAKLNPGGQITDDSRAIKIDGPAKEVYYGYKMVVAFQALGYTAYYGLSGTDWKDPPILAKPTETREIGGTDYLLFYDGDRLRMVGWKEGKASYWVSNTLGQLLSEEQMLGIATGAQKVDG